MVALYFNSEIVGYSVPCIEKFRGLCFRPLHYFLEGETRTWDGFKFILTQDSYSTNQKSCLNSFKMAVLIVPALIIGTIATIVALAQWFFEGKLSKLHSAFVKDSLILAGDEVDKKTPFTIPTYELTAEFSPNASHKNLGSKFFAFIAKLTTADKWKDPSIRLEFGQMIEEAHKEMTLLFQHAAKAANNDPIKMESLMSAQHVWSDKEGENYCRAFFYISIGTMYYAIRTSRFFEKTQRGFDPVDKHFADSLKPKNSKPFFTPGTAEYRWRRLYNDACSLIDRYPGLREAFKKKEDRFLNCAIPDFSSSTAPSGWTDRPTC